MMVGRDLPERAGNHSLGAFPGVMGLARMERAKSHNRLELESRANRLSTESCN